MCVDFVAFESHESLVAALTGGPRVPLSFLFSFFLGPVVWCLQQRSTGSSSFSDELVGPLGDPAVPRSTLYSHSQSSGQYSDEGTLRV